MVKQLLFLLLPGLAHAATYYVATNGSNSNPGSSAQPWLTWTYAQSHVSSGDIIHGKPGVYNETVTPSVNGVIFEGERDSGGEWLTIIDPSIATTTWSAATEIGAGVWKTTTPWEAKELTINNQRVPFVFTNYIASLLTMFTNELTGLQVSNGVQVLLWPSNQQVQFDAGYPYISFWDRIGALWAATNTTTYLRLRDGSDPTSLTPRIARNHDGTWETSPNIPTFLISNRTNITVSNLWVRNGFGQIYLNNSPYTTIISNKLTAGHNRVYLTGTPSPYSVFAYNECSCAYYGSTNIGAFTVLTPTAEANSRQHIYGWSKYIMGRGTTFDEDFNVLSGGTNLYMGNYVHHGIGVGLTFNTVGVGPFFGDEVCSNTFANLASVGVTCAPGSSRVKVHDNTFLDVDIGTRFHFLDQAGETERIVYCYRNKYWNPPGLGDALFFHLNGTPQSPPYYPEIWIYHNSFASGRDVFDCNSTRPADNGGHQGVRFLNNIISYSHYAYWPSASSQRGFATNSWMIGAWDYNLLASATSTNSETLAAWVGPNNIIIESKPEWPTNTIPNFRMTYASRAVDVALDLSQPFNLLGTNYPALPEGSAIRAGLAWDMGALEAPVASSLSGGILRGGSIGR